MGGASDLNLLYTGRRIYASLEPTDKLLRRRSIQRKHENNS